jgi:heme/copper-type cytochrome/quinol oxidase subunit 2
VELLLAQMQHGSEGGSLALSIVALIGMIIPLVVLGVVCWIFWKAKKRDEAEERRLNAWRNAHSS